MQGKYSPYICLNVVSRVLQRMHAVTCECVLGWDGYQCGYCGAEFKTKAELTQHQLASHPSRGPGCAKQW